MAETSTTSGGLDSLLDPHGNIKKAMDKAARTWNSNHTYFVTNGTSTANKIVVQALIRPGDIVLVDRNCHKSHHYGLVLAGAHVVYLDAYPLDQYGMYGAVPVAELKRTLLAYRQAGKLNRVKLIMLTNCTFDGIVYDPARVMEECLAIKPDLVFPVGAALFPLPRFPPVYRRRPGMAAARPVPDRYRSAEFPAGYPEDRRHLGAEPPDADLLGQRLLPDPDAARIRVYVTQSTH